jgi:hypothetical protein
MECEDGWEVAGEEACFTPQEDERLGLPAGPLQDFAVGRLRHFR